MKIGTILIMTLMISSAICKDETEGKQQGKQERSDRVSFSDGLKIGFWAIFGIVFGIVFVISIIVCFCCLPWWVTVPFCCGVCVADSLC